MKDLWTLRGFVWRFRWRYVIGILSIVITDLSQLAIPWTLGRLTDDLNSGLGSASLIWTYIGWIFLASVGIFIFRYLWRVMIFGVARTLEYELRNKLFAHYQKLSPQWYSKRKTGDLMAHATNDLQAVRFTFGGGMVVMIDTLVLFSLTIAIMVVTIDWKLTLIGLLPLPVMAFLAISFGSKIYDRFRDAQEAFSALTDRVQENISGMRVVKAFAQEEEQERRFADINTFNFMRNMRMAKLQAFFNPLVQWVTGVSYLLVLGFGGILVIRNQITIGDFVAFNAYLGLLIGPIMGIGWMINIFQRGAASMSRINEILYSKPDIQDNPAVQPISKLNGHICIESLTFRYPGSKEPALRDVTLDIPQGQTVALIGKTGSGKSTLVNLLVRLYDVKEGSVRIDGHALKEIPLAVLRRDIGMVPQENFLFSETIRENIAFGLDQASEEEIVRAAEDAQVLDNIQDFPGNFETMLGERGVTLSGGQKQRLSIARALIKHPSILVLDDSLSAVDTKTEEALLERLKQKRRGLTTIMIAHRVSTVQHADQIVVLDEGRIVERGTHEQLLRLGGVYHHLYEQQQLEEQISGEI
ncbi:ABC transporter ATP-binding protein [Xylanibacillus composti]|uniref:Multidrug ABC transporter permease/ATP-binding protein n=1 Tax=Xylanibacillus composti TaxID=1572762 RepID=A0A8J4H3Z2_9BACL|nr:ABC transporter ATP-binding protein [Xylanibacillus composti]MDT9726364.1 ABC transporter ATP-binding protein [Xylanibacillus composti]GIQ70528.1 multidrug ABC transporter permease/ATP-binding protein [Xylanibacillus composti]